MNEPEFTNDAVLPPENLFNIPAQNWPNFQIFLGAHAKVTDEDTL